MNLEYLTASLLTHCLPSGDMEETVLVPDEPSEHGFLALWCQDKPPETVLMTADMAIFPPKAQKKSHDCETDTASATHPEMDTPDDISALLNALESMTGLTGQFTPKPAAASATYQQQEYPPLSKQGLIQERSEPAKPPVPTGNAETLTSRPDIDFDATSPDQPTQTESSLVQDRQGSWSSDDQQPVVARETGIARISTDPGLVTTTSSPTRESPALPAKPVLGQIGDALVTATADSLEIALSPEELGRIRMVLSGPERSPVVAIWAERPDVLDLIRRNAAALDQHFCEAGFENANFEFHDAPSRDWTNEGQSEDSGPGAKVASETEPAIAAVPTRAIVNGRIDMRL